MKLAAAPQLFSSALSSIYSSVPGSTPTPSLQTSYIEQRISTIPATTRTGPYGATKVYSELTITSSIGVTPTVASPTALSTTTITDYEHYPIATYVQVLLAPGSGKESTISYGDDDDDGGSYSYAATPTTNYLVDIVYTPFASCSQTFSFTTAVTVTLPSSVVATMPALATKSYSEEGSRKTYTGYNIQLDPTAIPAATYSSISRYNVPYGLSACYTTSTKCSIATALITSAPAKPTMTTEKICTATLVNPIPDTGYYGSIWDDDDDKEFNRRFRRTIIIACVAAAIGVLKIIAWFFICSYMNFAAMMCGKERKRGVWWCFLCVPFFISCMGARWKARSEEDQAVLTSRWRSTSLGQRVKLWLKYSKKWKYPVELLGDEPERINVYWTYGMKRQRQEREQREQQQQPPQSSQGSAQPEVVEVVVPNKEHV